MEKQEKLEKLENAVKVLKTEFVGLDSIIDEIKHLITPWYITPQVLSRPIIISLWGMTGTGKTSLVKRLLELLEVERCLEFNCGSFAREKTTYSSFESTICSYISDSCEDNMDQEDTNKYTRDMVFILDEFQHARTVGVHGEEIERSSLQPVWTLADSGRLVVEQERSWIATRTMAYLRDLENMVKMKPESSSFKIDDFFFTEPEEVLSILDSLGSFWWDRGVPSLTLGERSGSTRYGSRYCDSLMSTPTLSFGGGDDNKPAIDSPLKIFPDDGIIRFLLKECKMVGPGRAIDHARNLKSVKELIEFLQNVVRSILTPVDLDCSNSLVFIIGNLDEAFSVSDELNPDMDADIFYDITSKITIHQLKSSLLKRFRPEQVARIGNNIIKYPVLKSEYFKKIIKNEVTRLTGIFENTEGIKVSVTPDVFDLIYSEGVYPTQGVRPVFTTINSIYTPILSVISIKGIPGKSYTVEVIDPSSGYKAETKDLRIIDSEGNLLDTITVKLVLGSLRIPGNCKTRYIKAVHEVGHAIMSAYYKGTVPSDILAVGVDSGGWCVTYDGDEAKEIDSKEDIKNKIRIALGGYKAEELIYGKDNILMGSSSDIEKAYSTFTNAIYTCGYYSPIKFANNNETNPLPTGISNDLAMIAEGDALELPITIQTDWINFEDEVKKVLEENVDLIKQTALILGEKGRIGRSEFIELVKKYGKTLTEDRIKESADRESCDFYKSFLL